MSEGVNEDIGDDGMVDKDNDATDDNNAGENLGWEGVWLYALKYLTAFQLFVKIRLLRGKTKKDIQDSVEKRFILSVWK